MAEHTITVSLTERQESGAARAIAKQVFAGASVEDLLAAHALDFLDQQADKAQEDKQHELRDLATKLASVLPTLSVAQQEAAEQHVAALTALTETPDAPVEPQG